MASETARRSWRLALIHPSAIRPTRRSATSAVPPSRIGGAGRWTGLGSIRAGGTSVNSPWNSTGSSAHSARSAATYSAICAPRRANVAPTAANSCGAHPDPEPDVEAAAAQHVDGRQLLGQDRRGQVRRVEHGDAQPRPRGHGGGEPEGDDRVEHRRYCAP